MKVEKARETFCPFVFIADKDRQNQNSSYKPNVCRGSVCMMWRWSDKSTNEGYCGIAGAEAPHK